MMSIRKPDVFDTDFMDAAELISDGYLLYKVLPIVSTTNSTRTVVVNPSAVYLGLIHDIDNPLEVGDRVRITDSTAADGYYIVESITDNTSFVVIETIADSTDGYANFMYPVGASRVGFDSTGLTTITADNVQDAITELALEVEGGGVFTEAEHRIIRQLIHFIDEGPAEGFVSGAYAETLPPGDPFPTEVIWWESSAKLKRIVKEEATLNINKTPATVTWTIYDVDGVSPLAVVTDTISYIGVFETDRTRVIFAGAPSSTVVTEESHRTLRQLIHFISDGPAEGFASNAYREIIPSASPFPTAVIWWESSAKLKKIIDKNITRNPNNTPATTEWNMYAIDGVSILTTVIDTHTYSGIFEISRTRSIA